MVFAIMPLAPLLISTSSGQSYLLDGRNHFCGRRNYKFMMNPLARSGFLLTFLLLLLPHRGCARSYGGPQSSPGFLRRLDSSKSPQKERKFHLWPAKEIRDTLLQWASEYPDFLRVTTSQEAYGLPRAGGPNDCPFDDGQDGCLNYILTIQDFTVHPEGSDSSNRLPEVLWSGCVHGNERVGPTATMEAVLLLLEAASCESKPRRHGSIQDGQTWVNELTAAKKCRESLHMSNAERQWLARLVATRRIVVVPTANALGYARSQRTEGKIDPNRDFPFDLTDPKACMQTVAGRTLNEVFREHMFQLSLTFHGGMEVIAYEWGAPTYLHKDSPDDTAQEQIAAAYSLFAGGFSDTKPYQHGTMNDLVYYVRGGMEDWAYAGSWDKERVVQCQPTTFGGYPAEKTVYNNSTLRVFNMLVETSDHKIPGPETLGNTHEILHRDTTGNGHVSRNIRLALLAADLVEPYVDITKVNELEISDKVVPMLERADRAACQQMKEVLIPSNSKEIEVEWTVGGGLTIDETTLWYGKWDDVQDDVINCMAQPDQDVFDFLQQATGQNAGSGTGFFSKFGAHPPATSGELGPTFRATLDVSQFKTNDKVVVVARASIDNSWLKKPKTPGPPTGPQAHVVNARTNPDWHHESAGKIVQGRLDWYTTIPLTLLIGDFDNSIGTQGGLEVGEIELSNRFGHTTGKTKGGISPTREPSEPYASWKQVFGLTLSLGVCAAICVACIRYRRNAEHQRITNELIEEAENDFEGSARYKDSIDEDEIPSDEEEEEGRQLGLENGHSGEVELQTYTID